VRANADEVATIAYKIGKLNLWQTAKKEDQSWLKEGNFIGINFLKGNKLVH